MRQRIFLLIITLSAFFTGKGQIDTEFWFAVPEVTYLHADRPVFFRISSMDQPAKVKISQPANPLFLPLNFSVEAGSTVSIDITTRIHMLENNLPDQVLNRGILIESTAEITVYYEILGSSAWGVVNCDIFTLKGKNALGKTFFTPFQNFWDNNPTVDAWSSFDIIATEDSTEITITPSADIVGHGAGTPFTIMLHKGQTYSARATSHLASNHLHGSKITSSKPIAVTIKDDSILQGSSYDLAGDQIVSTDLIGTEYVISEGEETPDAGIDRIFICATENSTDIFINGNITPAATLQEGETYAYEPDTLHTYISSNNPVYVFHIAGFGNELGGAILPPLGCTGSRRAAFTRPTDETFALNIVVKNGGEDNFTLNGSSTLVPASAFVPVTGTGGNWLAAQIKLSTSELQSNTASVLINDSADFHLGIMNGAYVTGFRYGYFSDYAGVELGPDKTICKGDSILLNAGFGKSSYLWNTGETSQTIWAKDSTKYSIEITKGACTLRDSLFISFYPEIPKVLPKDTTVCSNAGYIIEIDSAYSSYSWQDGNKNDYYRPTNTGIYWVEVTNENGCKKRDSITVTINPSPRPVISYNQNLEVICWDSTILLDAGPGYSSYKWHNGAATQVISTPHLSEYYVTVTDANNCTDSTYLQIDCSPIVQVYNLFTPDGNGVNEVFYVKGLKPDKWSLEVYSRWGDRVYYNQRYNNEFDGNKLESDIYFYVLTHIEGKKTIKGWVQIVKDE